MDIRTILRLEGAAVFGAATYAFVTLDGPWWLYLLLILAPVIGMLGYIVGPSIGARTYNVTHTYTIPLPLAGVGWWSTTPVAFWWRSSGVHTSVSTALWAMASSTRPGFKDTLLDPSAPPPHRLRTASAAS